MIFRRSIIYTLLLSILVGMPIRTIYGQTNDMTSFSYGHYYVKVPQTYLRTAERWVKDVNDHSYPEMIKVLGKEPEINFYIVEFTHIDIPGVAGYYDGVKTVDGYTGGHIVLDLGLLRNLPSYPDDLFGGLTYETIHGFLMTYKFPPYTPRRTVLDWDESFDILFEAELMDRLGLGKYSRDLEAAFYKDKMFAVIWDIRQACGWRVFQNLFTGIDAAKSDQSKTYLLPVDVQSLSDLLSAYCEKDLTEIFRIHGYDVNSASGEKARMIRDALKSAEINETQFRWVVYGSSPDMQAASILMKHFSAALSTTLPSNSSAILVGGPLANPHSVNALLKAKVHITKINGRLILEIPGLITTYVTGRDWGKRDYSVVFGYREGTVRIIAVMGLTRYGTLAAAKWLASGGNLSLGYGALLYWADSNDNGDVDQSEIRLVGEFRF